MVLWAKRALMVVAIVWITSRLISRQDQYKYPVGRRRLEPIGVLVFSVIMCVSISVLLYGGLALIDYIDCLFPSCLGVLQSSDFWGHHDHSAHTSSNNHPC